jgi:hypothetical protein
LLSAPDGNLFWNLKVRPAEDSTQFPKDESAESEAAAKDAPADNKKGGK